jgi:hypothetical protein
MEPRFTIRAFVVVIAATFQATPLDAKDLTEGTGHLIAQNKKTKNTKNTKGPKNKAGKNKKTEIPPDSTQDEPPPSEIAEKSNNGKDSKINYVYQDTLGAAPAAYQVTKAKVAKTEVQGLFQYISLTSKSSSEFASSSVDLSGQRLLALATLPVSQLLAIGGGVDYLTGKVTTKFSSDSVDGSTTVSFSSLSIPMHVVGHLSSSLDAGLALEYYVKESTTTGDSETTYSYLTIKPGFGIHGKKFEASLSYQPLVKAKGKTTSKDPESSSTSSDEEYEVSSEFVLAGRFLVSPLFFVGAGFQSDADKTTKATTMSLEAGMNGNGFQIAAGLNLKSTSEESESSGSKETESENGFVVEAVSLAKTGLPRFSGAFSYAPTSKKADSGSSTGSSMALGFGAQMHF